MKLSEAIREGAKLGPKCTDNYSVVTGNGQILGLCALGAAAAAISKGSICWASGRISDFLSSKFPVLDEPFSCPEKDEGFVDPLHRVIAFLNDNAGWSREQIADWLAEQGL